MASLLPSSFYLQDTAKVARALLGQVLCIRMPGSKEEPSRVARAMIVETEAYLGTEDRAAHTYGGRRTKRVESMYLSGGHAYVYFIYGKYFCLNVVTRNEGVPEAVLVRAVEPLDGEVSTAVTGKTSRAKLPTNGPGKLCRYYGITREDDGVPLFSRNSRLWIEEGEKLTRAHVVAKRVGVDYAGAAKDWDLRFYLEGNPYVSRS